MASATTSSTQIANRALDYLGSKNITSLTDPDTEEGRIMARNYPDVRDELFEEHFWNFCTARATISADPTAPDFEFDNRYALPNDYLQLRKFNGYPATSPRDEYQIEDGYLLSNADSCEIVYTYRNETVEDYSAKFVKYFALSLAAETARNLAGSQELMERLEGAAMRAGGKAKEKDTTENQFQNRGVKGMVSDSQLVRRRASSAIG